MYKEVYVYADGSGHNTKRVGGWSYAVVMDGHIHRVGYNEQPIEDTTSNKMELRAVIQGLLAYHEWKEKPRDHSLIVVSDSEYVIKGAALRLRHWLESDWRGHGGDIIKNQPEWKAISIMMGVIRFKIRWAHTRGHVGNRFNEVVDKLADYRMTASEKIALWNRIRESGHRVRADHSELELKFY